MLRGIRSYAADHMGDFAAMRLTLYTDYSLRVLMYLGLNRDGLATITEVAERYGISRNHLMKIVHQLGLLGYIETVRGKGGGIRFARSPGEINLGEVIRRTEEDMALVQCFDSGGSEEHTSELQSLMRSSYAVFCLKKTQTT